MGSGPLALIDSRTIIYVAPALLCLALIRDRLKKRSAARHPPSPKSLPIVGHIFSIPPGLEHLAYMKLGEALNSDIIYLKMLHQKIIILNSAEAATELFDKRWEYHSDRMCPPMLKEPTLIDWGGLPSLVGYNELWRQYRRMMDDWLNARAIKQFYKIQEEEISHLLKRMLDVSRDPQPFQAMKENVFYTAGSTTFQLAYGYRLEGPEDPFYVDGMRAGQHFKDAVMFTNFLVNLFPVMIHIPEWFPGAGWKRVAREWRKNVGQAMDRPYAWTKTKVENQTAEHSLTSALLQDHKLTSNLSSEEKDRRLKELAILMYLAGADTTATGILNAVAIMVLHPEIQSKVQSEMDAVLGPANLPTVADRDRLPYTNRVLLEVLRWRPITPTGVPHVCFSDDNYRGYDIEKGTLIFGNLWAMSRDESVYENAEVFNPDRFLDPNVPPLPGFGWGRRKCPGNHFAENSIFIAMASLLAAFTFSKKKDMHGNEIDFEIEGVCNALILEPKPFEFEFKPRSEAHRQLVLDHNSI